MKNIYEILGYIAVRKNALISLKGVLQVMVNLKVKNNLADSFLLIVDAEIRMIEQLEKDLQQFKNNPLPDSIQETLNSGNGTYKP